MEIIMYILGSLLISLTVFGGGPVFIPIFQVLFVDNLNWYLLQDFLNLSSIISTFPGPMATKYILVGGLENTSIMWTSIAVLIFNLIPIIMVIAMYNFFAYVKKFTDIHKAIKSLSAVTIGVLISISLTFVVGELSASVFNNIKILILFSVSFLMIHFLRINKVVMIVMGILIGIIDYLL